MLSESHRQFAIILLSFLYISLCTGQLPLPNLWCMASAVAAADIVVVVVVWNRTVRLHFFSAERYIFPTPKARAGLNISLLYSSNGRSIITLPNTPYSCYETVGLTHTQSANTQTLPKCKVGKKEKQLYRLKPVYQFFSTCLCWQREIWFYYVKNGRSVLIRFPLNCMVFGLREKSNFKFSPN